jgi:hypothetical protein
LITNEIVLPQADTQKINDLLNPQGRGKCEIMAAMKLSRTNELLRKITRKKTWAWEVVSLRFVHGGI